MGAMADNGPKTKSGRVRRQLAMGEILGNPTLGRNIITYEQLLQQNYVSKNHMQFLVQRWLWGNAHQKLQKSILRGFFCNTLVSEGMGALPAGFG